MKVCVSYCYHGYKEIKVDDKFNILKYRSTLSPEEEEKLDCDFMSEMDNYFSEDEEIIAIYSDDDDDALMWEAF